MFFIWNSNLIRFYLSVILPVSVIYFFILLFPKSWFSLTSFYRHSCSYLIYIAPQIWSQFSIDLGGIDSFDDDFVVYSIVISLTGYQWGWDFTILSVNQAFDHSNLIFSSIIFLPISGHWILRSTSSDVSHCLSVPSILFKSDCIPGKFSDVLLKAQWFGLYSGNCYEFCGEHHSFMPIYFIIV